MTGKWLDYKIFKIIVQNTPLIAIDLIIENEKGEILLGRRKNPPAKGFLFVPGSRIFKGEYISEAFKRITYIQNQISKDTIDSSLSLRMTPPAVILRA